MFWTDRYSGGVSEIHIDRCVRPLRRFAAQRPELASAETHDALVFAKSTEVHGSNRQVRDILDAVSVKIVVA